MRVKYVLVKDFLADVGPADCRTKEIIDSGTYQAVQAVQVFRGCRVFVWDGACWDVLDKGTQRLLVADACVKAVQPSVAPPPTVGESATIQALRADTQAMQIAMDHKLRRSASSTRTEEDVGKHYYNSATMVTSFPGLAWVSETRLKPIVEGIEEVLRREGKLPAAKKPSGKAGQPRLPPNMILAHQLGSPLHLVDTHCRGHLHQPTAQIDCSGLASELVEWNQLVVPLEFRLQQSQFPGLLGQLITRCHPLFANQPQRKMVYAVAVTMKFVEVFAVSRKLTVEKSGPRPLSLDASSSGLQLLAQILASSLQQLGFEVLKLPQSFQLKGYQLNGPALIASGTPPAGSTTANAVFRVTVGDEEEASVLKLTHDDGHEERILQILQDVPDIVQLRASGIMEFSGVFQFLGGRPTALLLTPYGRRLEREDDPAVIATVAAHVARAIEGAAERGVQHRDISPFNFLEHKGRGLLCDFSVAQEVPDFNAPPSPDGASACRLTGTPLFAAVSVMKGGPHSLSSMFEGLFYSILYIGRGGTVPDEHHFRASPSQRVWAEGRRGCMMCEAPPDVWGVAEGLAPLVRELHVLFWPQLGQFFGYRTDVTCDEVVAVCDAFLAPAPPAC